jgi:ankyrin repeat protein
MSDRKLPVRPDLDQLKHQAKDLVRQIRRRDPAALEELKRFHHEPIDPARAKLADAQLVLARAYGAPNWPRLVLACRLIDAIWRDDVDAVRKLVMRHPQLMHEEATIRKSNWGPPMTYAANLGRDAIIKMLHELGATDLRSAAGRATLQGQIGTARMLHAMLGSPRVPDGAPVLLGPAESLSASGTALLFEFGARVRDANGKRLAPVDLVLETYCRNPSGKHQILELYVQHGLELPDTPTMAVHRGRIDLLAEHLRHDRGLLRRTFTHEEIYPPELGCHDEVLALHGTPLKGATLLHLCFEYDEMEIARWLLERGMNVDAKAAVDADGFGGHTALFGAVVSYANFMANFRGELRDAPFARLLLDHGANPNARASLRKQLADGEDRTLHEYRDVTPVSWGERFHGGMFVSKPALRLIAERGGHV